MINMAYSVFFKFSGLIAHTVLCHQIQFKKSTSEIFKWHDLRLLEMRKIKRKE